ncbi:MAG: phosphoglycerate dehydrogenase [Thermoguttaceae bacterium]|nr:phosphoglycerate dehydrogenase [Thermoguttaceae bacterium]
MAKIVVLDPLAEDGLKMLQDAGLEYEVRTGLKGEELRQTLLEFDGAICRSGVKITADALEGNKRLKAIARAGVGVDNIDLKAATRAGIVVMNTPGGNTVSTAEQTFALMLSLSRNTCAANQSLVEGRWDRKKFTGRQLGGKTLGIVGMGRVGQTVAKFAKAFDMKLVAFDPYLPPQRAQELDVKLYDTVAELLPLVDYLTVHTPLTDATRNLISDAEIAAMKDGVCLINCARGGIYNMEALQRGLESGKLGGVALDVYPEEPCTDSPLFGMPHVVCTPHLGASTTEAQMNVALEAVELLVDYLKNGVIRQAVNFSSLDPKTLSELRGALDLAYRLGCFAQQIANGPVSTIKIQYRGEITKKNVSLVTSSFCAGYLTGILGEEISVVSSAPMMQERGLKVVEEKDARSSDFSSIIGVELEMEKSKIAFAGALFGAVIPRLIQYRGLRLDSQLDGSLLLTLQRDQPGIVAELGAAAAKRNVNIAQMALGRNLHAPNGLAVSVLSLDGEIDAQLISDFKAVPGVETAVAVKLPGYGEYPSWMN